MRLYGGRILKSRTSQQITNRQELRDAVVMSVDQINRYALVKIQGSNTNIKAYYPENWESTPVYLKKGNAVRINQPGGNKARIEIMGFGMLLPTTVPGGSVTPLPDPLIDGILSGCIVSASDPASMEVIIAEGTYRIDEVVYVLAGTSLTFDAADTTSFRYDIIVAGTDMAAHIVKGNNAATPLMPATPVDHVFIAFALIPPNCTAINQGYINGTFNPRRTVMIAAVPDLTPVEETFTTTLRIAVVDQYNNPFQNSDPGWTFTISWKTGTSTLTYDGTTYTRDAENPSPFSLVHTASGTLNLTFTAIDITMYHITEVITGYDVYGIVYVVDSLGHYIPPPY